MTQEQALEVLKTGANVFLTGEPGSGKTYLINAYERYLREHGVRVAVTASTGIAATHLGGVTIHSWSGIGIKRKLSKYDIENISGKQYLWKRIHETKVLVIDEVSMLDGAVLDNVNRVCKAIKGSEQVFGGMQVILVGDFFQLPPVAREEEGSAQFAFESLAWKEAKFLVCYLTDQYRQEDGKFLKILQALRQNRIEQVMREALDARAELPSGDEVQEMTRLYSHNMDVDAMNERKLQELDGAAKIFAMKETGKDFLVEQLKRGCLSPERLAVKVGARVMFTKNDKSGKYVNGTLGRVVKFDKQNKCPVVKTNNGVEVVALPVEWTMEDNGRVLARVAQVPLRLAWALTIHKSQGVSLDAAVVSLEQAFEPGQGYVALSRVRTLTGLYLSGYNERALEVHPEVLDKDGDLRRQSEQALAEFGKIDARELTVMQHNFIKACGGKLKRRRKMETLRDEYPNAYRPWEEVKLVKYFGEEWKIKAIAQELGRQPGAITSRLRKLGLVE